MTRRLIRYVQDFGRMGSLRGLFVAEEEDYQLLQKLIENDTEIYWGEVLGKHSDVTSSIEKDNISSLSVSESFIDEFILKVGSSFGDNPLEQYEAAQEEEEEQ